MKFIFSILFIGFYAIGNCQSDFCGTSFQDEIRLMQESVKYNAANKADNGIQYIPIKVHNVGNDNSLGFFAPWIIFESMCTLNQDFLASGIQFYLDGDFNYIRNTSWNDHAEFDKGEEMMLQSNFPKTVNCYLVTNPAGNCGYYTYRGDAVALGKNCLGKSGHTWAHELGHYFTLPHTFFGWEGINYSSSKQTEEYQSQVRTSIENVVRDQCKNQADNFCDTHPDYISNRWSCVSDGFSGTILKDTQDSTFRADGSLFMSYANDVCMSRFSFDQMESMFKSINGQRSYLKRTNVAPKFIDKSNVVLQFPVDSQIVNTSKVFLSWEPKENATYYIIQISRTEHFSVVIKNLLIKDPFIEIDSLTQGKNYWWRVRAFSNFDFCGAESNVGFFKTKAIVDTKSDESKEVINLIPNPARSYDKLQLEMDVNAPSFSKITIRDLNGQSFPYRSIEYFQNNIMIELDNMPNGVYFISYSNSNAIQSKKLIINNTK